MRMLTFQSPGAWAAFMDALESIVSDDGFARLHAESPAWRAHKTTEDLRVNVSEYQLIEASRKLGVLSKGEMKLLHGHLAEKQVRTSEWVGTALQRHAWLRGQRRSTGSKRFQAVPSDPVSSLEQLVLVRLRFRLPLPTDLAILRTCRSRAVGSAATSRRGGRVVECGSLENCLAGIPRYEGSNPSLSARRTVSPGR